MAISFKQYRDRQFVFGFSMERVPDSSYTGINTRSGQMMQIRVKPTGASIPATDMPDQIYNNITVGANIRNTRLRFESFDSISIVKLII